MMKKKAGFFDKIRGLGRKMTGVGGGVGRKMGDFKEKLRFFKRLRYFWAGIYLVPIGAVAAISGFAGFNEGGAVLEQNNTITGRHLQVTKMAAPEMADLTIDTKYVKTENSTNTGTVKYANAGNIEVAAASVADNTITINGRTLDIVQVSNTSVDAGNHVNRIGRLYYGHNYANVFGDIARAGSFTIREGGVERTYTVTAVVTVPRTELDADTHGGHYTHVNNLVSTGSLCVNGKYGADECDFCQGYAGYTGAVVLMTCAGTLYGNGDASHRVVVFAS